MKEEDFKEKYGFTKDEWDACIKVLSALKESPLSNPNNQQFGALISKINKNAKKALSKVTEQKAETVQVLKASLIAKNALLNKTFFGEESLQVETSFQEVPIAKRCYSCSSLYNKIHSFYHRLCPSCAELNFTKRHQRLDLKNRKVILTGGRAKVGYASALKFLRCGANVTVTTRFPLLAYDSFKQESDFSLWKDDLFIYELDLRIPRAIEEFVAFYKRENNSLDILINNAAQTIKYDQAYYQKIAALELRVAEKLEAGSVSMIQGSSLLEQTNKSASELAVKDPSLNRFGQPIDYREQNSWTAKLEEVDMLEVLEVSLINQIAPYILIKELAPLMRQSSFDATFIVNVTSSEGQFSYSNKTKFHPHTNMTKAALNMLTHTSAADYAKEGIYMNCVDVGWISTGVNEKRRERQFEMGQIPPLDPVDGAARILHPIYEKLINNKKIVGKLLKNYVITDW